MIDIEIATTGWKIDDLTKMLGNSSKNLLLISISMENIHVSWASNFS